jgi:hypothetical protein
MIDIPDNTLKALTAYCNRYNVSVEKTIVNWLELDLIECDVEGY